MKTDEYKEESYHEQHASLDGGASVVVVEVDEVVSGVLGVVITVEVVVVASVVVVSAVQRLD